MGYMMCVLQERITHFSILLGTGWAEERGLIETGRSPCMFSYCVFVSSVKSSGNI